MSFPLWLQPIVFWRMAWNPQTKWPWNTEKTGRFKSWQGAVLAFIIRYCIVITFTIC